MTAAQVHDALAAKLGALASVDQVYGDGTVNTAVKPWPGKIVAMPAVLVRRGATEREAGISRELYRREWEADFYLPAVGNSASAMRAINTLDDQLLAGMRTGIRLDGLVSVCRYLGSNAPTYVEEGEDEDVTQYVVWTTRFETEERLGTTYTV